MTAESLLRAIDSVGGVTKVFSYPYLKVIVASERFANISASDRESTLAEMLGIPLGELRQTASNALLLIRPVAPGEEPEFAANRSTHWLAGLTASAEIQVPPVISAVHFYGYKGGQSRSTVLAEVALSLANDGWRILAIDGDIEAPSLDTLFGASSTQISSTLVGIAQGSDGLRPITVFVSAVSKQGTVDLINCWPKGAAYSIDSAAFALKAALDPTILERAMAKIKTYAVEHHYDCILVDHRTGISPGVLPIMASLPGRAVIAIRLDEQWQPAAPFLKLILKASHPDPGLFVVWKPDTEDIRSFNRRTFRQREDLLEMLADAFDEGVESDEDAVSTSEVEDHLVVWPYDSAFRGQRLPEPSSIDLTNQSALERIRSLLQLGSAHADTPASRRAHAFNISGARDEGDLILTRALRDLLARANPHSYILGRKGTGKTRLARELSRRNLGELLLVPADSLEGFGIQSGAPEILDAIKVCESKPEHFWLALFNAGMQLENTGRTTLISEFQRQIRSSESATEIIASWQSSQKQRIFLLDSLETTFPSRYMGAFLDSLFRILSLIEADSRIADKITFRLFLRRDLAQPGFVQNIEQQLFGKSLELSWDYQSILNFMLSRINQNPWYARNFPELAATILDKENQIREGAIGVSECEQILLMAFPSTVKRNNLSTATFLRTYFADSATDSGPTDTSGGDDNRRYYPRVFDDFLREISSDLTDKNGEDLLAVDDGRIAQPRIFRAHEIAANNYLQGLKQELAYLVNLSDDLTQNQNDIDRLLGAFDGRQTPFKIDSRVSEIADATGIPPESVRRALEQMKGVGMFEARPDYPGEWRVGRLFKSSLRMKYVRKKA